MNHKILIIEDEKVIINFLTAVFSANDYEPLHAYNGKTGIMMAASHNPDLIILDLGLPDMDGLEVLSSIREWSDVPVIVVSARQSEHEKVKALDAGANDYITKPFGNSELLARVRSSLRIYFTKREERAEKSDQFSVGKLHLDYAKRTVKFDGNIIRLTPTEYRLVLLLSKNAGKVLTHDYMIREIWGAFASDSQVLRVNMANIRRKLEPDPADPKYILTEVGVGYRMIDQDGF